MPVKVDSQSVDARVITAWKAALKHSDEADLQEFAAKHANLSAGFRKGKVSLPVVVSRIKAMLDQSTDLTVDLRLLLRNATLSRSLLCVLSQKAIDSSHSLLASAYGKLNVYAAMLLDERESIRERGFEQIASWDGVEPTGKEQEEAIQSLQAMFTEFLEHVQILGNGARPVTKSVAGIGATLVHRHDKKTGQLIVDLREKRQEVNRLRRELQLTQAERDRANTQVQELTVTAGNATTTLNLVTQNYAKLRENFAEQVRETVSCEVDERLVPWLGPAEELAQAAQAIQGDLLQEAEELLQRQASIDQKFGLRSQLDVEKNRCRAMQLRLKEAIKESIRPLPEIGSTVRRLEKRITEIETILQQTAFSNTKSGQAPTLMVEKLQQAQTLEEVATVRRGLLAMESTGLLGSKDVGAAFALIGDVASRLYLQASLGLAEKTGKPSLKGVPLYALQRQLADGHRCTLLIDGHNVLHKLPILFGEHFERGDPGTKAQQALIQKIVVLCSLQEQLTVDLWFDSVQAHDETLRNNFNVHYSGGTGVNRADDQIVAYLQYLSRHKPRQLRALVTADRDEAAKAEASGALIISPLEFSVLIS